MSPGVNSYAIVLDRATAEQRESVHGAIKDHAEYGWWHRFTNLWLVRGGTAPAWRNIVEPHIEDGAASVLVLKLDAPTRGSMAYYGTEPDDRIRWLMDNLGPPETPPRGVS